MASSPTSCMRLRWLYEDGCLSRSHQSPRRLGWESRRNSLELMQSFRLLYASPSTVVIVILWAYAHSSVLFSIARRVIDSFQPWLAGARNRFMSCFVGNLPIIHSPPPFPYPSPHTCPANLSSFIPVSPACQGKRP